MPDFNNRGGLGYDGSSFALGSLGAVVLPSRYLTLPQVQPGPDRLSGFKSLAAAPIMENGGTGNTLDFDSRNSRFEP